jgi:hypothetical protein
MGIITASSLVKWGASKVWSWGRMMFEVATVSSRSRIPATMSVMKRVRWLITRRTCTEEELTAAQGPGCG